MDKLLTQILSGITICIYQNHKFYIKNLDLLDKLQILNYTIDISEMWNNDQCIDYLIQQKYWSKLKEETWKQLPTQIENLKVEYYNAYVNVKRRDFFPLKIKQQIETYIQLTKERNLLDISSESYLDIYTNMLTIGLSLYDEANNRIWKTISDILDDDFALIMNITNMYINQRPTDDQLRQLSKYYSWKTIWSISSNPIDIFGIPIIQLNDDQKGLLAWSHLYDNIKQSSECPDDIVLNDDYLLDGWLLVQSRNKIKTPPKLNNITDKHNEVFIVAENKEDIDRVYNMNNPYVKQIQKERFAMIQKHGVVEEQNFPDSKQKIQKIFNEGIIKHG